MRALAALNGNAAAYIGLLQQFGARHGDDVPQLRDECAAGLIDAALQRLHAAKGVAGTLGATRIQAAASALEQALRSTDASPTLPALLEVMQTEQSGCVRFLPACPKRRRAVTTSPLTPPGHGRYSGSWHLC